MKVWRFNQPSPIEAQPLVPDFVLRQAENLVRIINESAQLAAKSPVFETRQSRLGVALDHLVELKNLVATYPRISVTQLEQLEDGLQEVSAEIDLEASFHPLQRGGLYDGWEYRAEMRFSTPLRQLALHGERDLDKTHKPNGLDDEHGGWRPKLKTFREMGIDMDQPSGEWMASPIGPIPLNGGDYIKFLIATRKIAELRGPAQERKKLLRFEIARPEWAKFSGFAGHYVDEICNYFFPTFLSTVPALPHATALAMWDVALDTPQRIDAANDEQLLAFKGVGPAVLRNLRIRCAEITHGRDESILDFVRR